MSGLIFMFVLGVMAGWIYERIEQHMSRREDNTKSKVIIINGRRFIDESVIEDIQTALKAQQKDYQEYGWAYEDALETIDKKIKEVTYENKV